MVSRWQASTSIIGWYLPSWEWIQCFLTWDDRPRPGRRAVPSGTTWLQHERHSGDQPRNGLGAPPTWAVHSNEECVSFKLYYGTRQSSVRAVPWWTSHSYHIIHIIYDGVRPRLNLVVPQPYEERFTLRMLRLYSPFLNLVEQAHSCFKTFIKNELARQEIQAEPVDGSARRAAGLNKQQCRCNILLRLSQDYLGQAVMAKCAAWCGRVHRYIPAAITMQPIVN